MKIIGNCKRKKERISFSFNKSFNALRLNRTKRHCHCVKSNGALLIISIREYNQLDIYLEKVATTTTATRDRGEK